MSALMPEPEWLQGCQEYMTELSFVPHKPSVMLSVGKIPPVIFSVLYL